MKTTALLQRFRRQQHCAEEQLVTKETDASDARDNRADETAEHQEEHRAVVLPLLFAVDLRE